MLKQIGKTALAMGIIMVFYFVAGASVVVNSLEGTQAKLSQGIFIWLSVMAVVLFYLIRFRSIADLGFHKVREGSIRELLYLIPMLVVALLGLSGGVNFRKRRHPCWRAFLSRWFLSFCQSFSDYWGRLVGGNILSGNHL